MIERHASNPRSTSYETWQRRVESDVPTAKRDTREQATDADDALADSIRRLVDGSPVRSPAGSSDRSRRGNVDPMDLYDRALLEQFEGRGKPASNMATVTVAALSTTFFILVVGTFLLSLVRAPAAPPSSIDEPVGINMPFP